MALFKLQFAVRRPSKETLNFRVVNLGKRRRVPAWLAASTDNTRLDAFAIVRARDQLRSESELQTQRIGEAQPLAPPHLREGHFQRCRRLLADLRRAGLGPGFILTSLGIESVQNLLDRGRSEDAMDGRRQSGELPFPWIAMQIGWLSLTASLTTWKCAAGM
jgi:hypothetical protein